MYSPKIILTIGDDDHLEVVSLDQMNSIENFRVPGGSIQEAKLLSSHLFIAVKTLGFDKKLFNFEICLDY